MMHYKTCKPGLIASCSVEIQGWTEVVNFASAPLRTTLDLHRTRYIKTLNISREIPGRL